jgi:hypothetical protein
MEGDFRGKAPASVAWRRRLHGSRPAARRATILTLAEEGGRGWRLPRPRSTHRSGATAAASRETAREAWRQIAALSPLQTRTTANLLSR